MSKTGVEILENRISNVIEIHRKAEDVSNAEIIGLLEMMKLELFEQMEYEDEY